MKTKLILTLIAIVSFNLGSFAQGITNDGATIVITSGTTVSVTNGGYLNLTNGSDGQIDLDGVLQVDGDFENRAANNVFINTDSDGEVVFAKSGVQTITSNLADMSNFINFEKVTINSGSDTQLAAGSAMTVNGDLSVAGDFSSLTPTSDAASGSIITNGSIIGAGDVNLHRYFKVGSRWQFIAVPIANQTSTPLIDDPYPGYVNPNFYTYNEQFQGDDPTNSDYTNWNDFGGMWENVPTGTSLSIGTGYIWNAPDASDVNATFTSVATDLSTGDKSVTVTYRDNDQAGAYGKYYDGWNFVGNPFPSALNWDDIDISSTSIDNTIYFWDGDNGTGNYIYYYKGTSDYLQGTGQTLNSAAAKEIPAYQCFSIHLTPSDINDDNSLTSETLTLLNSARVHSNTAMYKSDNDHENVDFQFLRLRAENDGKFDETIVRFIEGTEKDFNGKEDAFKMFPWDQSIPMIYSLTTETQEYPLAINSLPLTSIGTTIPLGFKIGEAGTFTIEVTEFNFDAGTEVKLIDTQEKTETTLYEGAEYTFKFAGNDSRDRFYLFSKNTSDIEDEPNSDNIQTTTNVWSNANKVFISISSYDLIDAEVQIFDMLGKTVIHKKLNGTYNVVNVPGSSGTYFVKLRTKDGQIRTDKVFIQK